MDQPDEDAGSEEVTASMQQLSTTEQLKVKEKAAITQANKEKKEKVAAAKEATAKAKVAAKESKREQKASEEKAKKNFQVWKKSKTWLEFQETVEAWEKINGFLKGDTSIMSDDVVAACKTMESHMASVKDTSDECE